MMSDQAWLVSLICAGSSTCRLNELSAVSDVSAGRSFSDTCSFAAQWIDGAGCVVTNTNNTILAATFIYSMVFDLLILLLSMYKLVLGVKGGRSQLMTLLFKDGLVYFFIAYVLLLRDFYARP